MRLARVCVLGVRPESDREALVAYERDLRLEVDRRVEVAREMEVVDRRPVVHDDRVRPGGKSDDAGAVREEEPDVEAVARADDRLELIVLGMRAAARRSPVPDEPQGDGYGDGDTHDPIVQRDTRPGNSFAR